MLFRLNRDSVRWCNAHLGDDETVCVVRLAIKTETFRRKWIFKWLKVLRRLDEIVAQSLITTGGFPDSGQILPHIEEFLGHHAAATVDHGLADAHQFNLLRGRQRLSRNTLSDLQRMWDKIRKGKIPSRQKDLARKIKTKYIQKCQSVWEKHSQDFRIGEEYDQKKVVNVIKEASDGVYSRGKMIVETETTRYYNQARKSYFDQSPEVTHYLFLAIMDVATTQWCKTRHRLVYQKDDDVTKLETPPIHWNCRSEMLPLTPMNPRHKIIIENRSLWRENRKPARLPVGWNK